MSDASVAVDRGTGPQKQILLVSNDPASTTSLEVDLESGGFDVMAVKTAAQMRAVTERLKFDVVILDNPLPDSDAWQALRWLCARCAVPVFMLTDRRAALGKGAALQIKPDDYLPKPVDQLALLARLRGVLNRAGPLDLLSCNRRTT
jgi:DNA-binding response OmpR family regulator